MTSEELDQIVENVRARKQQTRHEMNVCVAAGCLSLHSDNLKDALEKSAAAAGIPCRVRGAGCMGLCSVGPLVSVEPGTILYQNVKLEHADALIRSLGGKPVENLKCSREQPFFTRQFNVVLENSGKIDPEKVDEYIAREGYRALFHALTEMTPAQVVQEVSTSG